MVPRTHRPSLRCLLGMVGAIVLVGSSLTAGARTQEEGFWADLADPARRRYLTALAKGKATFEAATSRNLLRLRDLQRPPGLRDPEAIDDEALRRFALEQALTHFDEAVRVSPGRAEAHQLRGRTLYLLSHLVGPDAALGSRIPANASLLKGAVEAFLKARQLDPTQYLDDYDTAFSLGIAYSSLGEFEKAVLEYDRAERLLARAGSSSDRKLQERALLQGNAAECLMATGRLGEAIARYQEAATQPGTAGLANWGLAVAYDRDEQVARSLSHIRQAMIHDTQMSELTRPTTFFVPDGEIHYYFALGYLAQGQIEKARQQFERYLEKQPQSPWAPRARAHLARLSGQPELSLTPAARPRLAPRPGQDSVDSEEQDRLRTRLRLRYFLRPVQRCYEEQLRKSPELAGQMRIAFQLGEKGKADKVKVSHATTDSKPLERCVINVIKGIDFLRPTSTRVLNMDILLDFKPAR